MVDIRIEFAMTGGLLNRIVWAAMRRMFVKQWVLGALVEAVGLALLATGQDSFLLPVLIVVGVALLLLPAVVFVQTRRQFARVPEGRFEYHIDADAITSTSPIGTGTQPWTMVRRIRETRDFWLLRMLPNNHVLALPKSTFSPTDLAAFREFASSRSLLAPR